MSEELWMRRADAARPAAGGAEARLTVGAIARAAARSAVAPAGTKGGAAPLLTAGLPPAFPGAPLTAVAAEASPARGGSAEASSAVVGAARADLLWWPAARADAASPALLAVDSGGSLAALEAFLRRDRDLGPPSEALLLAEGRGAAGARLAARYGLAPIAGPERLNGAALRRLRAARPGPETLWARLGGVATEILDPDAAAAGAASPPGLLAFWDPWRERPCPEAEGLEIARFFAEAGRRRARPVVTVGLSPWKRRTVEPFLTGAAGPPLHRRGLPAALALAEALDGEIALWGASRERADALRAEGRRVLLLEDGFVRSVGLGVRHERACSLVVAREALHFEADRISDLRAMLAGPRPSAAMRARAARLRRLLTEHDVSKYNLGDAARSGLPETDRRRVLVAGQVERDASLRYGGGLEGGNLALLRRVRARWPEACVVYKPHPDVVAGYRRDAALKAEIDALADAVVPHASARQAIAWAEVVETVTSQLGFEALLRGKRVVCHGAPFYGGLGLTEDLAEGRPPLSTDLEDLIAVALVAYPLYVAPQSRILAPPEVAIEALIRARGENAPLAGLLWKRAASRVLNWLP